MLHVEFVLPGPPVSHQTKDPVNLKKWQATVRAEASKAWTAAPLTGKLLFLLINFHEGDTPPLDDDNMVKPIRDALNGLVYEDDRQIRYSVTIQEGIEAPMRLRHGSQVVLDAFRVGSEFLYVRIEDAPPVLQLPR